MKIKKGDNIIVIAGKDKGKKGKVLRSYPKLDRVLVEDVNVGKKHQRATKSNQKGQIIERATPIHVSNVQVVDPKAGVGTRIGYRIEKGKKVRIARKSDTTIS